VGNSMNKTVLEHTCGIIMLGFLKLSAKWEIVLRESFRLKDSCLARKSLKQLSAVKESCQQGEALAGFRWKANPFNEYRFQPSLATVAAAGLLLCMSSGALRPQQSSSGIVLKNPKSLSQWYTCIAACLVNIYISMCILSVNF
jgi:hypothetical protein